MGLLDKFRKNNNGSLRDEIQEHLCDLFSSRKNYGAYPEDYGIDSYINSSFDKNIELLIMKDIKQVIQKYESRIQHIEIRPMPASDNLQFAFALKCRIQDDFHTFNLSFNTKNKSFNVVSE